jgi:hypothetical protein
MSSSLARGVAVSSSVALVGRSFPVPCEAAVPAAFAASVSRALREVLSFAVAGVGLSSARLLPALPLFARVSPSGASITGSSSAISALELFSEDFLLCSEAFSSGFFSTCDPEDAGTDFAAALGVLGAVSSSSIRRRMRSD